MTTNEKIIAISILAISAVTVGVIVYTSNKKHKKGMSETDTSLEGAEDKDVKDLLDSVSDEEQSSKSLKPSKDITSDTMKLGSSGRPVALIQSWLNYKYGEKIDVDGRFGAGTRDAIRNNYITYPCGYGGVGDPKCPISYKGKVAQEAVKGLAYDKTFQKYFINKAKSVWKEFEPMKWGNINFGK